MHTNQVVIQRTIQLILLINIFFLTSIHCISMANPLIKIDRGAKNHQHYTAHTTSSKTKPKRSSNSHYSHHQHTKAAHAKSGSRQSRPKQSKVLAKHHSTPQHTTKKSQISSIASDGTTHNENRITQQYDPLTLLKTADHLFLEPGEYGPTEPAEQKNYLQQKQEQQLNNINLHAVNWGIDLLKHQGQENVGLANLYFSNETNGRNCETDMHYHSWDPGGLTGTCAQFSCAKGGMATYKEYCQRHNCILNFRGVTKHSCSQEFVQQVKTVCAKNRERCRQESYDAFAYSFIKSARRKLADVKIGGISIDFDSLDPRVKSLVIDREGNQTQKGMLMFKEALKHHHLTAYSPVCAIAHAFADEAAISPYIRPDKKRIVVNRIFNSIKKIGCD